MSEAPSAYRRAGVDIDKKYAAVAGAAAAIRSTFTKGVVGDVGMFGGPLIRSHQHGHVGSARRCVQRLGRACVHLVGQRQPQGMVGWEHGGGVGSVRHRTARMVAAGTALAGPPQGG